jgi:hypothetical protein
MGQFPADQRHIKKENRTGNSKTSGPVFSEARQASPDDRISQGLAQAGMAGALERTKSLLTFWDGS